MAVDFDKTIAPSVTRVNDYLIDPRELKPDPILNGRVELPDIEKFKNDFRNPAIGQLQPITIKKVDGAPIIVDGVSRWRAALELTEAGEGPANGVFKLQCRYFYAKNAVDYFIATIKGNIRNEPKPEDDAHNVSILVHNFNMSEEDVAANVYQRRTADNKPDVGWVRECLALNNLTPEGLEALKSGKVKGIKAAVALSKLNAKVQRDKLKRLGDGEKLTVAAIKRDDSAPRTEPTAGPSADAPASQERKKPRSVGACIDLVQQYINMDLPSYVCTLPCAEAVHKILGELYDEMSGN